MKALIREEKKYVISSGNITLYTELEGGSTLCLVRNGEVDSHFLSEEEMDSLVAVLNAYGGKKMADRLHKTSQSLQKLVGEK